MSSAKLAALLGINMEVRPGSVKSLPVSRTHVQVRTAQNLAGFFVSNLWYGTTPFFFGESAACDQACPLADIAAMNVDEPVDVPQD